MKVFLAALLLIGAGVFGMCVNIIFRKKDFPQTEVGHNDEMRKRGIRCMREIDDDLFNVEHRKMKELKGCDGEGSPDCEGCGFNPHAGR